MIIRYTAGSAQKEIVFDATLREVHTASATVTEHAVETGSKIADHFRPASKRLSIEAVISNTPITPVGGKDGSVRAANLSVKDSQVVFPGVRIPRTRSQGAQVLQFSSEFNRVKEVVAELRDLAEKGTLLEILQGVVDYQDMVIVNLSVPRDAQDGKLSGDGRGARVIVNFDAVHIRFVQTSTVDAPAPRKQNKVTSRGAKGTKEAKPDDRKEEYRSFASALLKTGKAVQ